MSFSQMRAAEIIRCPFCAHSAKQKTTLQNANELWIDGDRNSVEFEVDCHACGFPVRGSIKTEHISLNEVKDITNGKH